MISLASWVLAALGIIGAAMNAGGRRESFAVWIVANSGMLTLHATQRRYPEALLFGVYLVTAVYGWRNWRGGLS